MMKKLFLFVVCLASVFTLVACGGNDDDGGNDEGKKWYETDGNYTYNDFIGGTTSMNWSPLSWETNDDSYVLGYLSMGFYDYTLNETGDNWVVVPEMAESLPTDVTANYVGQYGIAAGEKGKAWSIKLNKNAVWENGEKITSEDYVYSMTQQLDPDSLWRRADSYYGGDFSIYNAKNYLYNGKFAYSTTVVDAEYSPESYYTTDQVTKASNGQYIVDGKYVAFSLNDGGVWSSNSLTDYYNAGYIVTNVDDWNVLKAAEGTGYNNMAGWIPATDATVAALNNVVAELHGFADAEGYAGAAGDYAYQEYQEFCYYGFNNPEMDFAEVGLFAEDEYEIVVVLERELQFPDFYLPYYLSSTWLINESMFESCWETKPDGTRVNTYMQSLKNSISYGPYKLSYFEADKQITFVRNENWYGYEDGKHEGQFITDKISCQVIPDHATQLMAFENGLVDGVGLQSEDLDKYGNSNYLLYSPESYTTKLTINTDLESLQERESEGVNKRILTVKEFREAISLMLDRNYFTTAFTAAGAPGYGLMNYMYQVISENGSEMSYRNYQYAKDAILNLYGIEYGEGTPYADIDDAYAAITGYDMESAKACMQEAYDYAVANGLYTDGETIQIRFSVYNNDTIYKQMYEYVKQQLNLAAAGTPLEGKIELEMYADEDYYNSLYAGNTDVIFSTWGGATYGSLTLLAQCYCDDYTGNGNQMELGFNTGSADYNVTVEIPEEGKEFTATIKQWADWLNHNATIAGLEACDKYSVDTQVKVCAAAEGAYLAEYTAIPLYYRQVAQLYSQKINYATNQYVNLVGFGGMRTITYNYTDEAWAAYIANNKLVY